MAQSTERQELCEVSKAKGAEEKAQLPKTFQKTKTTYEDLNGEDSEAGVRFAVPSEFLKAWRLWIRNPANNKRPTDMCIKVTNSKCP